ncbi:MAG: CBS domain-containing protein, partial [Chitinophagaceae bacterium]|nr:CBS domain-containing protein [Chitinophagaceae bacterium]
YKDNERPAVSAAVSLKEVIVEMTQKRLGVTAVIDEADNLLGIITDGDLRRMLEKNTAIDSIKASDIMSSNPKTIGPEELAVNALDLLRKNEITQLVVTENNKYLGIIHLHDLIKEGLI